MTSIGRRAALLAGTVLLGACADLALEADRIPTSVEISPRGGFFTEGETVKLRVVVYDQNDEEMPVPSWAPTWKITDTTIVRVARDGTMSTVGGGEVVVGVEVAGSAATARFRVNPNQVDLAAPVIYLNQAAQNRRGDVPLIPGRPGLLRVFVVGDETSYYEPSVRVTLFRDGSEVFREVIPAQADSTSTKVMEAGLTDSYNVVIPGHLVHQGTGMVVELDPEGVVPLGPGARTRYPATGTMPIEPVEPPLLRQIMVPTIAVANSSNAGLNWTEGLHAGSARMRMARTTLSVGALEVEVRETYRTGNDLRTFEGWSEYINEVRALYLAEGQRGYYYGVVGVSAGSAIGGLGFIGFPVSVGLPYAYIYAHELGHNMNLLHAPCGGAGGFDGSYPHSNGSIGIWGYDVAGERLLDPDVYNDLMGYCGNRWVSDYHFKKAFDHRLNGDGGVVLDGASDASRGDMLVVWGRIRDGRVTLDPAFLLNGPAALPDEDGPYRVEGIGVDGQSRFSVSFSPTPLEYGGGGFVFLVPWEPDWAGTLDRMVLTGPEGTDTVTRTGSPPIAVVTDRSTGVIRAIIRDWDGGPLPGEAGADVTISRGIPGGVGR
ncbi:MAG: M66 family metalloprotease [Gemmatimonadota bacterium]|nr:M66 family metalloprotease [Gemmatimonadota bacterium]